MDIRLQPISPEDRTAVIDLFNHYVEHGFAAFAEVPLPYAFFDRFVEMAADLPTLTAKDPAGKLLAFALLRRHSPWSTTAHVAEITYFVAPDCTRQGIGSMLLAELERQASPLGICIFLASISALNEPSLVFHRKHGFDSKPSASRTARRSMRFGCRKSSNRLVVASEARQPAHAARSDAARRLPQSVKCEV